MDEGDGGDLQSGPLPDLLEFYFFRRIVMHKVPRRYRNRYGWRSLLLSISHCGKICRLPINAPEYEKSWCDACFPDGPPHQGRVDI